ncbi:MAG: amidohydrolase family protein [Candidatus Latescibacterota bacterium]|nr:amidohydrolase family protein [Candidatus Latescibacterota bacterium]
MQISDRRASSLRRGGERPRADLVIRGGTVVDGTGSAPVLADVAITGGRIIDVGAAEWKQGEPCLDASGLLVTPGFIDIHSHSDFTLTVDPRAVSSIAQGVTLEVVGNCGHGCAPIGDAETAKANVYGYCEDHPISWSTVAEYLACLEARQPAVNVLTLVPNGNLRLAVAASLQRPSSPEELLQMKRLLAQGMEEGAYGFSTGLEYGPELACSEEEVGELCRVAAGAGGLYATHTRNRPGEAGETIAEAIRTATLAEVPLQISHISVVARLSADGGQAVAQAIEQVDRARERGIDAGFDMHTRLFGTTNLSAVLPPWALAGGKEHIASRLADGGIRQELKQHQSIVTALARDDWSRIVLTDCRSDPASAHRDVAEIAASRGGREPLDVVYDILLDEIDDLHLPMIMAFCYREEDIRPAFDHPDCMVGSDATALAPDGPLAGATFHGAYTWAAWFYRHFVRDVAAFTPEEAVRRLTSLPARRLGLSDRGVIRQGACADLAIFDPETFGERGTTIEPNRTADGMAHVVVNGKVTLKGGKLTGERGGHVLRRGG